MYKWDFNLQQTLGETFECDNPAKGPDNTSRWNTGRSRRRRSPSPTSGTRSATTCGARPCFAGYSQSPVQPCPRIFPELGQGGVGPHGATKYEFDPDNPSETKFPPYYDGSVFFAEWTRDYLQVRSSSTPRASVLKINNLLDCGRALVTTPFPFECDNPMDTQFGADGNFYMLTYGDGFFTANPDAGLYRFEYVAGPQRPQAVLGADADDAAPRRWWCSSRARGRAIRTRVTRSGSSGTSTATARSTRSIPRRRTPTPPTASTRRS